MVFLFWLQLLYEWMLLILSKVTFSCSTKNISLKNIFMINIRIISVGLESLKSFNC